MEKTRKIANRARRTLALLLCLVLSLQLIAVVAPITAARAAGASADIVVTNAVGVEQTNYYSSEHRYNPTQYFYTSSYSNALLFRITYHIDGAAGTTAAGGSLRITLPEGDAPYFDGVNRNNPVRFSGIVPSYIDKENARYELDGATGKPVMVIPFTGGTNAVSDADLYVYAEFNGADWATKITSGTFLHRFEFFGQDADGATTSPRSLGVTAYSYTYPPITMVPYVSVTRQNPTDITNDAYVTYSVYGYSNYSPIWDQTRPSSLVFNYPVGATLLQYTNSNGANITVDEANGTITWEKAAGYLYSYNNEYVVLQFPEDIFPVGAGVACGGEIHFSNPDGTPDSRSSTSSTSRVTDNRTAIPSESWKNTESSSYLRDFNLLVDLNSAVSDYNNSALIGGDYGSVQNNSALPIHDYTITWRNNPASGGGATGSKARLASISVALYGRIYDLEYNIVIKNAAGDTRYANGVINLPDNYQYDQYLYYSTPHKFDIIAACALQANEYIDSIDFYPLDTSDGGSGKRVFLPGAQLLLRANYSGWTGGTDHTGQPVPNGTRIPQEWIASGDGDTRRVDTFNVVPAYAPGPYIYMDYFTDKTVEYGEQLPVRLDVANYSNYSYYAEGSAPLNKPVIYFYLPTGYELDTTQTVTGTHSGQYAITDTGVVTNIAQYGDTHDFRLYTLASQGSLLDNQSETLSFVVTPIGKASGTHQLPMLALLSSAEGPFNNLYKTLGASLTSQFSFYNYYNYYYFNDTLADIDGNPLTETLVAAGKTSTFNIRPNISTLSSVSFYRHATGVADGAWISSRGDVNAVGSVPLGGTGKMRLEVANEGTVPIRNVYLLDLIPNTQTHATAQDPYGSSVNSEWNAAFYNLEFEIHDESGNDVTADFPNSRIYVSDTRNPAFSQPSANYSRGGTQAVWQPLTPQNLTTAQSFYFALDDLNTQNKVLLPGYTIQITATLRAPDNMTIDNLGETATNSIVIVGEYVKQTTGWSDSWTTDTYMTPFGDTQAFKVADPGSSVLGGIVFIDANENGAYDADADSLQSGITVALYEENGFGRPYSKHVATAVTRADGTYRFENLPGADYFLQYDVASIDGGQFVAANDPFITESGMSVSISVPPLDALSKASLQTGVMQCGRVIVRFYDIDKGAYVGEPIIPTGLGSIRAGDPKLTGAVEPGVTDGVALPAGYRIEGGAAQSYDVSGLNHVQTLTFNVVKNEFKLRFHTNIPGSDEIASRTVARGQTAAAITPNMEGFRAGYDFTGWNTAADGAGAPFNPDAQVTDDAEVYAQWSIQQVKITLVANDPSARLNSPSEYFFNYGSYVYNWGNYPAPLPEGYSNPTHPTKAFVGWYTAPDWRDGLLLGNGTNPVTTDLTVYARWADRLTLTVNDNVPSSAPDYNSYSRARFSTYSIPNPTESFGDDGTRQISGPFNAGATKSSVQGIISQNPQRDYSLNLEFKGWFTDPDGVQPYRASSDYSSTQDTDVTLYAKWGNYNYVVFDKNEPDATEPFTTGYNNLTRGPVENSYIVYAGNEIYSVASGMRAFHPSKAFVGWYMDKDCKIEVDESLVLTDNITVYAKWTTQDLITLTLNENAGDAVASSPRKISLVKAPAMYTYVEVYALQPPSSYPAWYTPPTRAGYTFAGWYTTPNWSDGVKYDRAWYNFDFDGVPASNLKLFARWELTKTLYFDLNYDDETPDIAPVPSEYAPITGLEHNSYYYNYPDLNNINNYSNYGSGVEFYGKYAPKREGYLFGGWYTDKECTQRFASYSSVTQDLTLYAMWGRPRTLTLDSNVPEGTQGVVDAQPNAFGTYPGVAFNYTDGLYDVINPTREGYVFSGWYYDKDCTQSFQNWDTAPDRDVTVYAKWAIPYWLYLDSNATDGSGLTDASPQWIRVAPDRPYYETQDWRIHRNPKREGYVFLGWLKTPNGDYNNWYDAFQDGNYAYQSDFAYNDESQRWEKTIFAAWASQCVINFDTNIPRDAPDFGSPDVKHLKPLIVAQGRSYSYNKNFDELKPIRPGYDLVGWYRDPDCTVPFNQYDNATEAELTIYAKWSRPCYITFDSNVAPNDLGYDTLQHATPDTLHIDFGSSAISYIDGWRYIAPPVREGYAFVNWYYDKECTQPVGNYDSVPEESITLYAKWSSEYFTVTFDKNNDDAGTTDATPAIVRVPVGMYYYDLPAFYNGLYEWPTPPDRLGYSFDSWCLDRAGEQYFSTSRLIDADLTLYARWRTAEDYVYFYPIHWDDPDEDSVTVWPNPSYFYGFELGQPLTISKWPKTNPEREGYVFTGWEVHFEYDRNEHYLDAGTPFTPDTVVTEDMTINYYGDHYLIVWATWAPEDCTVTFDYNYQGAPEPVVIPTRGGDLVPAAPEVSPRIGWDFLGWADGSGKPYAANAKVTGDVVYYAQWQLSQSGETSAEHAVTFYDGFNPAVYAAVTVTDGGTLDSNVPPQPQYLNYTFIGWFDGSGAEVTDATPITGDVTVTARWLPDTVNVTLNRNFDPTSDIPNTIQVQYNTTITELADYTPDAPDGFIFVGWNTQPDGGGDTLTPETIITAELEVYAQWSALPPLNDDESAVIFRDGFTTGEYAAFVVATGNALGELPAEPQRPHHTFNGWFDGSGAQFDEYTVIADELVTVTARWLPDSVDVTFNDNINPASIIPNTIQVAYNETIADLADYTPTRAGYTFVGWNTEPSGTGNALLLDTRVTDDTQVYAQWARDAFTVTFNDGSGADYAVVPVVGGEMIGGEMPSDPQRDGYAFDAWYTEPNGGGDRVDAATTVSGNMHVYANWLPEFTVLFRLSGVTTQNYAALTAASGTELGRLPEQPQRDGYNFLAWNTQPDGGGTAVTAATLVTGNSIAYAQWALAPSNWNPPPVGTPEPTPEPSQSLTPTPKPSTEPTPAPSVEPTATPATTVQPSAQPSTSGEPAITATAAPSSHPQPTTIPGSPNIPPQGDLMQIDDNAWVEFGDDGTPLGQWHFDDAISAWVFEPYGEAIPSLPPRVVPPAKTGDAGITAWLLAALTATIAAAAVIPKRRRNAK